MVILENGITDITFKRTEQIAEVFECDPLYIINYANTHNGIVNHFNNQNGNTNGTNIMNQYSSDQKLMEHYEKLLLHANEQIAALNGAAGKAENEIGENNTLQKAIINKSRREISCRL